MSYPNPFLTILEVFSWVGRAVEVTQETNDSSMKNPCGLKSHRVTGTSKSRRGFKLVKRKGKRSDG